MIYTVKSNPNFNLTADSIDEADSFLKLIAIDKFTLNKGDNTSGNWYKWNVMVDLPGGFHKKRAAVVKGRSEQEARGNTHKMFSEVTKVDLISDSPNEEIMGAPASATATVTPSTSAVGAVPANTGFTKEIPKVKPKYIFVIGDSAKNHGFHVFEATTAAEAWSIGTGKFKAQFPQSEPVRLGLWQRVLVPVHASKMWASADAVKGVKTPSHFAVDLPVGLGLSNEEWTGPEDMINTNDGVVESVVQKPITHVASK